MNPYSVLGLPPNCSEDDIKRKYRELTKKYHPDKKDGNIKKFKEVKEAYIKLTDPSQKSSRSNQYSDFNDIANEMMKDFFSGFSSSKKYKQYKKPQANDLRINLNISIKEGFEGCKKNITYKRKVECSDCFGSGCENNREETKICEDCSGTGVLIQSLQGIMNMSRTCPKCSGTGKRKVFPCKKCNGMSYVEKEEKIKINIPKGIQPGRNFFYPNKGDMNQGNLYISINILDQPDMQLKHPDIYLHVPLPMHFLYTGGEIKVPSFHGSASAKFDKNEMKNILEQRDGSLVIKKRAKGKGYPYLNGNKYGDLIVLFHPEHINQMPDELIEAFNKIEINEKTYPAYDKFLKNNRS